MESLSSAQTSALRKHMVDFRDIIQNCGKHPPTGDLEKGIHTLYRNAGLEPPKHIIVATSYREEKMIIQHIIRHGGDAEEVGKQIREYEISNINDVLHKELYACTSEAVRETVGRALQPCGIGEQWLTIKNQSVRDLPVADMSHRMPEGMRLGKKGKEHN